MKTRKLWPFVTFLLLSSLFITQCGTGATPAPPTAVPPTVAQATAAPQATTAPQATQAPAAVDYSKVDRKDTVIFDIDGGKVPDPTNWNPLTPGFRLDQGYHQSLIEPLFILNYESGKIEPWLGTSFTANAAQDVWTLKLRDGVKWSDGQPFNADDVVFTIGMLQAHTPDLWHSGDMKEWVKSVTKVDDLTVQFNLNKPDPRFQLDYFSVRIWGDVSILPKHIWEGQDPLTFKNYDPAKGWPVFTGPYKLSSFNSDGTEFVFTRDDNWWAVKAGFQQLPMPKKLVWTWVGPEEKRAAAMGANQLDSLMDITTGALQALKAQNPNVITYFDKPPFAWVPDPCSRTLEFNDSKAPWNDKDMRWAINYAIDRDQIVKVAYEDSTVPSRMFFPAYKPLNAYVDLLQTAGLFDKFPITKHDTTKTQQILESKGYKKGSDGIYAKDGKQLSIDITTDEAYIEKQRIAQVVVEQLQAAGINATTRNEADATFAQEFQTGTFEVRLGWDTCGSVNEPWASMDTMNTKWLQPVGTQANYDRWRWQGPAADQYSKLVDQIGVLPLGDPKINDLFVQAMTIWMDELPVIPVTQAKKIIPFNTTYWKGWPSATNNYVHPPTWWEGNTLEILLKLQPAQ